MQYSPKYVVISPAKNESKFIEETLLSLVRQTIRPVKWIIVDDGSTDGTTDIITGYVKDYPWIQLMQSGRGSERNLGVAEILAFNLAYDALKDDDYQFIVKLDSDVALEPDYFERILFRMLSQPDLGIASGGYVEFHRGEWRLVPIPDYHAAGASKVIRRECFEEIGGFVPKKGWDTLDEIRAQMQGWRTTHFKDIQFYHLKPEGSAMGAVQTFSFHGEIYYLTGGGFFFFLLKTVHRSLFRRPFFIGGLRMLIGYLKPLVHKEERLVTREEARFYRKLLMSRVFHSLGIRSLKIQSPIARS